jgi:hypothetical protein
MKIKIEKLEVKVLKGTIKGKEKKPNEKEYK